jgi:hypothetical protein
MPKPPIHGDPSMVEDVEAAVASLPEPVQFTLGNEAMFLVGGRRWRGWTGPPLRDTDRAPVFVVDGPDLPWTVAHEAAHRHLASPFVLMAESLTVREEQQLVAFATREGWPVAAADVRADEEHRLIDILVRAWTA